MEPVLLFQYNQVYYVESKEDYYANPVAIRPEIFDTRVQWMDTSKGKVIDLGKITNSGNLTQVAPDKIEIVSDLGERYVLCKLGLKLYNEKVKDRVMLSPAFTSDEEVQKFYLESNFEIM